MGDPLKGWEIRPYLVARRKQLGLSQSVVAKRMRTAQSALSELEAGQTEPMLSTLARWVTALDLSMSIQLSEVVTVSFTIPAAEVPDGDT